MDRLSLALVIIGAGFFMDRAAHTALVRRVVEDAKSWPVLTGPRVFFTGSNQLILSTKSAACVQYRFRTPSSRRKWRIRWYWLIALSLPS